MKTGKNTNDKLIRKVLSGEASSQDKKELNETETVESVMFKQWNTESERYVADKTGLKIWNYIEEHCRIKTKHIIPVNMWKWAAACVAMMIITGSLWFYYTATHEDPGVYEVFFAEQHTTLLLPDSSRIWMQPGSSVRYAKVFDKTRDIWFDGDAVFEITKHQNAPFRVHIDGAFVQVKGTVFRIQAHQTAKREVTLLNGLIDFHVQETSESITIKPSQRVTLSPNGELTIEELESIIGWQDGNYKFKETRMDILTGIVSSLYNTSIILDEGVSTHHFFNGILSYDEHPSEVIRRICYIMDLDYKKDQEKIIIFRPK